MASNFVPAVPSTPDPATQTLVYTAIRAVLVILGVFGISVTALADQSVDWALAGALTTLVGVAWEFAEKYQAAQLRHAAAVASANARQPLQVK